MDALTTIILIAVGCLLLLLACFGWGQPRVALAIAQWSRTVSGLDEPADLFYARVYQRLQERLSEAGLPDSKVGFGSGHLFGNRTIFGARPQYLMVRYADMSLYLYAFRLPAGLYVSFWGFSKYTLWLEHPVLKWLVFWKAWQMTLYQCDVTDLCVSTIMGALHEVLDEYAEERGLKPLEEYERRPILHSFYAKYKQGSVLPNSVLPIGYGQGSYSMPLPSSGIASISSIPPASISNPAPTDN